MKKKGQFYLIAALIIIVIIIGFATISNYATKKGSTKTYDLGQELGIEGGMVLDFGVMQEDVDSVALFEDFTELYYEYAGDDREIHYIFGNSEEIVAYTYSEISTGSVGIDGTGQDFVTAVREDLDFVVTDDNKIKVTIDDIDYEFELKPGDNFYFVISEDLNGEDYTASG